MMQTNPRMFNKRVKALVSTLWIYYILYTLWIYAILCQYLNVYTSVICLYLMHTVLVLNQYLVNISNALKSILANY